MKLADSIILFIAGLNDKFKFPWNRYAKAICDKSNVHFTDKESVRFLGKCILKISPKSLCCIGRNFVCRSGSEYSFDTLPSSKVVVYDGASLEIGDGTGISNSVIYCTQKIKIGNYVKIGAGTIIMDSNFHSSDWKTRRTCKDSENASKSPISIGDDVFIGAKSIICKGVTIGHRSIIAAGSVVVNDIPDDCIAGGNPCQVIKLLSE